jgi:hypothetical protein
MVSTRSGAQYDHDLATWSGTTNQEVWLVSGEVDLAVFNFLGGKHAGAAHAMALRSPDERSVVDAPPVSGAQLRR